MRPTRTSDRVVSARPKGGNSEPLSKGKRGPFENNDIKDTALIAKAGVELRSTSFISEVHGGNLPGDRFFPKEVVVDQVQQLIHTMEDYQKKAMKRQVQRNELQPIIKKMTVQSQSLSEVSKQLSPTDRLRSIVNQSLILSSAEIVNFNSGFYNNGQRSVLE
jgi:hypothetical protein